VGDGEEGSVFGVIGTAVHDADDLEVSRGDADAGLFGSFAHGGSLDLFAAVEVAGDDAVAAVFIAGLESAEQEDLPVADEEEADGTGGSEAVGGRAQAPQWAPSLPDALRHVTYQKQVGKIGRWRQRCSGTVWWDDGIHPSG
jgi:hypothetical protein